MSKTAKTSILVSIVLLLGLLAGLFYLQSDVATSKPVGSKSMGPIGVAYTLTDQNGEKFSSDKLQSGYQLVYFGFTICPDICPAELIKMTDALAKAGTHADNIQPVFITIDPARDTPEVLKTYLANFDKRFIGLTGTEAEIDEVIAGFKVYAAKVEDEKYSEYLMDHSSFIYLLGPNSELIKLFGKSDSAQMVADGIKAAVPLAAASSPQPAAN